MGIFLSFKVMPFTTQKKNFLLHLLIWAAYALLAFNWFSSFTTFDRALLLTVRALVIHAIIFYVNIKFLLPGLVDKNKYWLYLLSVLVLIVLALTLNQLIHNLMDTLSDIENSRPRRLTGRKTLINPRYFVQGAAMLAVLFISTTYWLTQQSRRRKQHEAMLRNEQLSSELKFLKSQINPHFLFNALNNIYALSYTGSNRTSELIMKLSDMMKYVLYESNEKKVSLQKELLYVTNFIDFQKLKLENEPNVLLDIDKVDDSIMIEPMLYIPFIENSFKHSNIDSDPEAWIKVKISSENSQIHFRISNTIAAANVDKTTGIGLENVKKRLKLLYPDQHELKIEANENEFKVALTILI